MAIMRSSPEARDANLIEELNNEVNACEVVQPNVVDRLRKMSEAIRSIHDLVREFAQVKDMTSLLSWYRLSELSIFSDFFALAESFLNDAIALNDAPGVNRFRRALDTRRGCSGTTVFRDDVSKGLLTSYG